MANRLLAFAFAVSVQLFAAAAPPPQAGTDTRSIPARRGDTLVILNDRGSIRIRPARTDTLEVQIRRKPRAPQAGPLKVDFQRGADTITFRTYLSILTADAVDFEIQAPDYVNVSIAGANPSVDVGGMRGTVHVENQSGMIRAEDLTSSVFLHTEKGDVVYRASQQPREDARIESVSGNIYFELREQLNLRCRFHAGGAITWNKEPAVRSKSVERQLGTQGPLLYAATERGNLEFRYTEIAYVIGGGASPQENQGRDQKKAPDAPKPAGPPAVSAQPSTGRGTTDQGGYTLKVSVHSVSLNVSVLDRNSGRGISQLELEDFLVYEDGVLQQIAHFGRTETPFNLLLLLDVSGSTESFLPMMKQSAIDFTRQIGADDRIAVATFNSSVRLVQGFTNDREAVARSIRMIGSGGGTAFYDALMECIDRYMREVEGRSAIVVFTDGVDNQLYGAPTEGSRTRYDDLYRRIQEIEPIIYPIFMDTEGMYPTAGTRGQPDPGAVIDILGTIIRGGRPPGTYPPTYPNPRPAPAPPVRRPVSAEERAAYAEAMQQLVLIAEQTGGRFYAPRRIEELSGAYSQIAADLRIQYQLSYNPTNPKYDGKWREIRVQVKDRPNAVVRTRKGYYARKPGN